MKKLTLFLIVMTAAITVSCQETSHYTAYRTQLFRKYKWQQEYSKIGGKHNEDIPVSLTGNTLIINSERSTAYVIFPDSKMSLDNEKLDMVSYDGFEMTSNRPCKVDFVLVKSSGEFILGITFLDEDTKISVHYFIRKIN